MLGPDGPELPDSAEFPVPDVCDLDPQALPLAGVTALKMLAMMTTSLLLVRSPLRADEIHFATPTGRRQQSKDNVDAALTWT